MGKLFRLITGRIHGRVSWKSNFSFIVHSQIFACLIITIVCCELGPYAGWKRGGVVKNFRYRCVLVSKIILKNRVQNPNPNLIFGHDSAPMPKFLVEESVLAKGSLVMKVLRASLSLQIR